MKYEFILLVVGVSVRATVVLDEIIVDRVRQLFGGNLSKGVNELLREHLSEDKDDFDKFFGAMKGRVSVKDLMEMEREEEGE